MEQGAGYPRSHKQERAQAFSALRKKYRFLEYELHEYANVLASRGSLTTSIARWPKRLLPVPIKQPIASVSAKPNGCAFAAKDRGIDSVEGKRNDVGMRFVLDPGVGDGGFLIWNEEVMPTIINWLDPVVQHGMGHKIKYVRLVRRKASSPQAQGTDKDGNRYYVQLVLEGHAFLKPKHEEAGKDTIGLDIGPSTLAIVPRNGRCRSGHVLRGVDARY